MPAGKPRYAKAGRDDYVFNRPAPSLAALPRATEDLLLAYRIFSPGLGKLADLDEVTASISRGIDNGSCKELMRDLGVGSANQLREVCKKSYNVYAAEIKRMIAVDQADAAQLAEKLAARKARKQAQAKDSERIINEEKAKLAHNPPTATTNKRGADDELTPSCPTKRVRHDNNSNDMIPDLYWLSKGQAQAALDVMNVCAKNLEATFISLQNFYLHTFVTDSDPADPTISTPLKRLETQICQDALWYVEQLQNIMAGAASNELGFTAGLGEEWKRDRFHNAVVRGLIERIREFGARLKDTEKEMNEADRLREEFVKDTTGCKVMGEMFLKDWAKKLLRVTNTIAHEAKEHVSFRTMEAEWKDKWAEKEKEKQNTVASELELEGEKARGAAVIVIDDSSDSEESHDSLSDDSESEVSEEE